MKWLMAWIKRTSMMSFRDYLCSTRSLREARITNRHGWVRLRPWSLMVWELEATGKLHTLKVIRSWQNLFKDWAHMTFKSSALLIRATFLEPIRHSSGHKIQKKRLIFWMRPSSNWSRSWRIHNKTSISNNKKQMCQSSKNKTNHQIHKSQQQKKTHFLKTPQPVLLHYWNRSKMKVHRHHHHTSLLHPRLAKSNKSRALPPLPTENHRHPIKSNNEVKSPQSRQTNPQPNISFFEISNFPLLILNKINHYFRLYHMCTQFLIKK